MIHSCYVGDRVQLALSPARSHETGLVSDRHCPESDLRFGGEKMVGVPLDPCSHRADNLFGCSGSVVERRGIIRVAQHLPNPARQLFLTQRVYTTLFRYRKLLLKIGRIVREYGSCTRFQYDIIRRSDEFVMAYA